MLSILSRFGFPINRGQCVTVDHSITTITVKIRSMNAVCPEVVKRLLQEKFEVVGTPQVTDKTLIV